MAYKILNGDVILSADLLPRPPENQLLEPHARIKTVENTFFYQVPKLWNRIVTKPQAAAPSIEAFKNHFKPRRTGG